MLSPNYQEGKIIPQNLSQQIFHNMSCFGIGSYGYLLTAREGSFWWQAAVSSVVPTLVILGLGSILLLSFLELEQCLEH